MLKSETSDPQENLERFLCGNSSVLPAIELLRVRRLEAWAYKVLPQGHPSKALLKLAFVQARARHELIKQDVLELVRAWNAVGIVPLIYKGFALAEFVYDVPGVRFHGDVDVLVRPEDFWRALEVGQRLGYRDPSVHLGWPFQTPHELPLRKADGLTAFDVHQRLVHAALPWVAAETRMTQMAWRRSICLEWEGVKMHLLSPEDAFLFGLMVARAWSSDDWHLKSHDLLDGFALIKRHQLDLQTVRTRARELGVTRTLELFLQRCHPWESKVTLTPPTSQEKWRWDWQISPEHLPQKWADKMALLLRFGPMLWRVLSIVPLLLEVQSQLHSNVDLLQVLRESERPPKRDSRPIGFTLGALWWAARLGRLISSLVWPVAVYVALQRRGWQPVFKLGELNGQQRAWVELEDDLLPGFDLVIPNWREYQVVFEHGVANK
jgi:Uncharacterised nucleotidyltransferase